MDPSSAPAPAPEPEQEAASAADGAPFDTGPGPPRRAFFIAYAGVVLAGLLGALIGYGVVDASCRGGCSSDAAIGAIVGAIVGALGAGVVAVLGLRAMAEWRRPGGPHT
jgi:hypothetical protein